MPILTHCFEEFPTHLEEEFANVYEPEYQSSEDNDRLEKVKQKMQEPQAKLYAAHFGGRWLAGAVVNGDANTRFIHHVRVHHGVRLRGIGKKLLSEIKRQESLAGNERLITCVSMDNQPAQLFLKAIHSNLTQNPEETETEETSHTSDFFIATPQVPNAACCYDLLHP